MARQQSSQLYQSDLAHIHTIGFGFHWEGAAAGVLDILKRGGIDRGVVSDLGCGAGMWLAHVQRHGYDVYGVDVSSSMIRAARQNVPGARVVCGSLADTDLPRCAAATALGEPLNYLENAAAIQRTIRRVFGALEPGGLFVLDVRTPADRPVPPTVVARRGADWACIAHISEVPSKNLLRRDITTFRRVGRTYRRSDEIHHLRVYAHATMARWLRSAGFKVRRYRGYGDYRLTARQAVFVARKPA